MHRLISLHDMPAHLLRRAYALRGGRRYVHGPKIVERYRETVYRGCGIEAKCPLGMDLLDCLERTYGLISFRESLPVPFACVNARSRFDELALCCTVPCAALQRRVAHDEESAVSLGAAKQRFQAAVGCSAHMRPLANGAFAREAIVSRPMSTREKRKEAVNQRAQLQPRPLKAFGVASRSVRLAGKASGRNVLASCQILEGNDNYTHCFVVILLEDLKIDRSWLFSYLLRDRAPWK